MSTQHPTHAPTVEQSAPFDVAATFPLVALPASFNEPAPDQWDNGWLGTPDPVQFTARVRLDKGEGWTGVPNTCSWCDAPALWSITEQGNPWADVACSAHRAEYFPTAQVPTVSLVKAGVPAHGVRPTEADLISRRSGRKSPWWRLADFDRPLIDNDPQTLAVAFEITANLRRSLYLAADRSPRVPYSELQYDGRC